VLAQHQRWKLSSSVPVGSEPEGMSLAAVARRLYVANGRSNTVSILDMDAAEVFGEVEVGEEPIATEVDPESRRIFSADAVSGQVSALDGMTGRVIAALPAGKGTISGGGGGSGFGRGRGELVASLVGQPLPGFRLPDSNGRVRTLDEFRGKVLMLNFFASW
jgi:YVTN family beta-propeller protein